MKGNKVDIKTEEKYGTVITKEAIMLVHNKVDELRRAGLIGNKDAGMIIYNVCLSMFVSNLCSVFMVCGGRFRVLYHGTLDFISFYLKSTKNGKEYLSKYLFKK